MPSINTFGLPPFEEVELGLASDVPRRWGLKTSRGFSLIAEPVHGALWLLCPAGDQPHPVFSSTSVISLSVRKIGNESHYQVGSQSTPLLREVYYFLCGVVSRAEQSDEGLPDVIESELVAWGALLRKPVSIDRNQEIGLLGELWVLWRILQNLGTEALDCWTGTSSEQHDFRLTTDDLEVKTTLSHSRDHVISSLDQLVTNEHRSLSVISIQLKPAGGGPGASLQDAVDKISQQLLRSPTSLRMFNDKITAIGYRHDNGSHYADRYCLRSGPTLVPVNSEFPRITMDSLSTALSISSLQRIRKVIYTANLDGMGTALDPQGALDALRRLDFGDLYA